VLRVVIDDEEGGGRKGGRESEKGIIVVDQFVTQLIQRYLTYKGLNINVDVM
jgi:hypothetical protein